MADELVDVAVVVGQQDPRLYVAPIAAGVVHQPAQREIHPRAIEQCQRIGIGVLPVVEPVGDIVGSGGQVGAGEYPRQLGGGHAGAGQLVALLDDVRIRDVAVAHADLNGDVEVLDQRFQLIEQIGAERRRMGHGDAVHAGRLDLGVGTGRGRHFAVALVGQAQLRVAEQVALRGAGLGAAGDVAFERLVERRCGLRVQLGQLVDRLLSAGGDGEGSGFVGSHGSSWLNTRAYLGCIW